MEVRELLAQTLAWALKEEEKRRTPTRSRL